MKDVMLAHRERFAKESASYKFVNFELIQDTVNNEILRILNNANYTILDSLESSIYWKNKEGKIMGCNKYMLGLFGLSTKEEMIGQTDAILLHGEALRRIEEIDQEVIQQGKTIRIEEEVTIASGEDRIYLTIKQPLLNEYGEIIGLVGSSIDITDLKKAQQREIEETVKRLTAERISQEEHNFRKAVTVHSGNLAHDLKNPIHANGLMVEMVQGQLSNIQRQYQLPEHIFEKINGYLNNIQENHALISGIIDSSNQMIQQISSDNPEIVLEKVPIEKLIRGSLSNHRDAIDSRLIQVHIQNNFEISVEVISFYRIMINLLENSKRQIKTKGKGAIFITALEEEGFKKVFVKDTAGGLTAQQVSQFFELYKTKDVQSTGIGLQGCRLLMKKMNGILDVQLVDGQNAEFVMTWRG